MQHDLKLTIPLSPPLGTGITGMCHRVLATESALLCTSVVYVARWGGVRGQLWGVSSSAPPCGFWGIELKRSGLASKVTAGTQPSPVLSGKQESKTQAGTHAVPAPLVAEETRESRVQNQLGLHSEILPQNSIPAICRVLGWVWRWTTVTRLESMAADSRGR